jgi:hypothetical protein
MTMKYRYLFLVVLIYFLLIYIVSADILVNLNAPADGMIFNSTNNVTLNCSVSIDDYLESVNLYHDISGSFSMNQTLDLGQTDPISSTVLLFHFNNDSYVGENDSIVYDWSANGNNGTVNGGVFNSTGGKFFGAFELNGSDNYIEIQDSVSIDLVSEGTIEFWLKYNQVSTWTSVITKDESCGYTFPYAVYLSSSGRVRLALDDWNVDVSTDTSLTNSTWYHVVTTWNESEARIYVNGSLKKKNTDPKSMYADTSKLRIGITKPGCGWGSGQGSLNGTIDELALYNIMLNSSDILDHYNRGLINQTIVNWTINNIQDGTYTWNCLTYDNASQSNWSVTNYTFSIDLNTSPIVNSIEFSPNSSDDIDPGVTLNVTANVTDVSNVSTVIFQYKECSECSWVNKTMNNIGDDEWNTSFTTVSNERVYFYRIWSNDTLNHSGYSSTYNLSVALDYSWIMNISAFSGVKSSLVNTVNELGLLIVNNTGDDTLQFTITSDWHLDVYYNGSTTCQFSLSNNTEEHVNITAMFDDYDIETNFTINVSADPIAPEKTASPSSDTFNITLNSYTGGPYFNLYLISVPDSTYHNQTFNLTFKIKNIGNESSTNTTLNWTIPSGWEVEWGNITEDLGTVTSGQILWRNLTLYVNPSTAYVGLKTVYVNMICNESINGSIYANIVVECNSTDNVCGLGCSYITDDDCSIPTSPGGGSSSVVTPIFSSIEPNIDLVAPKRISINKGESGIALASVHNTVVGTTIKNVRLSVSGHPQTHLNITPSVIDELGYNEKKNFAIKIDVPEYMAYGEYELTFMTRGTYSDSTVSDTFKTIFSIYSGTENETRKAFQEAGDRIRDMDDVGFNTDYLYTLLEHVGKSIDDWDFDMADELTEEILATVNLAFRIDRLMGDLEKDINRAESYGIGAPETKKMHSLAMTAFQRGDYERSLERVESALLTYSIETYGLVDTLGFVYEYWWAVAILIVIFSVIAWKTHRVVMIRSITSGLKRIESEEKGIFEMIKDYQKRYWQDKSISSDDYHGWLSENEKRLNEIMGIRAKLNIRKIRITADNLINGLEAEIKSVSGRIIDLQKKYFSGKGVSKVSYLMMMNGLNTEMTNIQNMFDAEKSKHGSRSGNGKKIAGVIVLAIIITAILLTLFVPYAGALGDHDMAIAAINNAEAEVQSLHELGFGTSYANDTLNEAKLLYDQGHYLAAESLALKVTEIKELTIETESLIDQVDGMIYESRILGVDVSPAEVLFNQVLSAFEIEDYVQANELLTQTINKLDELESESILQAATKKTWYTNIASVILENHILSIALVLLVIAVMPVTHMARKSGKIRKKMKDLEKEKDSLSKLVKDLQVKYFSESKISKSEYERTRDYYRKKASEIERSIKLIHH